ncbi:hypothetical protein SDC9_149944 [bioreactor metagenome]|uniref:Uncharacterized protein n=1 Tax=bioreactor metagenome TaxID=1076179 RepID=A0A645EL43_9ZZZZ
MAQQVHQHDRRDAGKYRRPEHDTVLDLGNEQKDEHRNQDVVHHNRRQSDALSGHRAYSRANNPS